MNLQALAGLQGFCQTFTVSEGELKQVPLEVHAATFHPVRHMKFFQVHQFVKKNAEIEVIHGGSVAAHVTGAIRGVVLVEPRRVFDGREQLRHFQTRHVVSTQRHELQDRLDVCHIWDEKFNDAFQVTLEEHALPAVAVRGDVSRTPARLHAASPVALIGDEVCADSQRKGWRQTLKNIRFMTASEFIQNGLLCKIYNESRVESFM